MTIINNIQIPEAFSELFTPMTYKVYYGGRDGAKSYTFAEVLLIKAAEKKMKILCVREYMSSIKDSVKSTLDEMIEYMDMGYFYKSTQNSIVGINGTEFIFAGIKLNVNNIKSTNNVDIAWVEEANTLSVLSWDILLPTIRKEGSEVWVSFNPYQVKDPVWQMWIENEMPNSIVRKVTYRDNPFSSQKSKNDRAYDRKHDPDKYQHKWEGNPLTISDAVIFKNKFEIDRFEAPEDAVFYLGLDLGFSVDPLAFIRCYIDHDNRKLYIDKAGSSTGVDIDDTPAFLESIIPDCKKWMITADNARPEIISYLKKKGFRVRASKKGAGSIIEGIEYIKNYTTIIHESLKGVIHEFSTHQYKVDRMSGEITPTIEDKNNHYIDALRYSTEKLRRKQSYSVQT